MRGRDFLITLLLVIATFVLPAIALATPNANISYIETNVGAGFWHYDYTFFNTSTGNEYLYGVMLDLDNFRAINNTSLASGWKGAWGNTSPVDFAETHTFNSAFHVAPGASQDGFGFTINSRIGDTPFTAYFNDHQGGKNSITGTTAVVPEPVSTILFITGGGVFAARRYMKRKSA
jgi:hypothetical protein